MGQHTYLAVLPALWMYVLASSGQSNWRTQFTAGKSAQKECQIKKSVSKSARLPYFSFTILLARTFCRIKLIGIFLNSIKNKINCMNQEIINISLKKWMKISDSVWLWRLFRIWHRRDKTVALCHTNNEILWYLIT